MLAIEEVTSSQSQYLEAMNRWLMQVFPEYRPARFDKLLAKYRHLGGRCQIQIFVGLVNDRVAGLVQVFYREWQHGLLADIDLLGVLEPFRRHGLASALVQRSLRATPETAQQYQIHAIGATTLMDPKFAAMLRWHNKQGGQVREDYRYPGGDIIVRYRMPREYDNISTSILGELLQQFGKLLDISPIP